MVTQQQRWASDERVLQAQLARRIRRTPAVLILVLGLLVLGVAGTAVVDLRRLQTPRGAALAWTEAAVFGDCRAFLALSRPVDASGRHATDEQVCRTLRLRTAKARQQAASTLLTVRSVARNGTRSTASILVRGPAGDRVASVTMVRHGAGWLVLRPAGACGQGACF